MKRLIALTGLTIAVCALSLAQENAPGRITIPANGNRPRTVDVNVLHGSVVVRAGSGGEIIIEAPALERRSTPQPPGTGNMHRLDMPWYSPLQVQEDGDTVHVNVTSSSAGERGLTITVPVNTSLKVNCTHGSIQVQGVHGEIELSGMNGNIDMEDVSGTAIANTTHGSIKAVMDRIDGTKPLSFVTLNGNVDLWLPAAQRATLKMKTMHGDIWSDFDVKMNGGGPGWIQSGGPGQRRMEMDRTMTGTINGGGTEITLSTFNGRILIHKK